MHWSGCWATRSGEKQASCLQSSIGLSTSCKLHKPPAARAYSSGWDRKKNFLVATSLDPGTAPYELVL